MTKTKENIPTDCKTASRVNPRFSKNINVKKPARL